MECVIPVLVGGALYIINKQKNEKEGFSDYKKIDTSALDMNPELARMCKIQRTAEPNIADTNYMGYGDGHSGQGTSSVSSSSSGSESGSGNGNGSASDIFQNPFTYTNQSISNLNSSPESNKFLSLNGEYIDVNDMTHNNEVPFMGSNVNQGDICRKGTSERNLLDYSTGAGTYHHNKVEIAPLFAPQESMGQVFGTQNHNDMMQSRVNASLKHNNTKPFEEIRVGPSSARMGDNTNGFGGFNAGMIGRDQWMPKNVDDLRVATNPKQTYHGKVLGGKSNVSQLPILGAVEKTSPDTYFINSPERYMTTTGIEKAPTAQAKNIMKTENRIYTTTEHFGTPQHERAGDYIKSKTEEPKRPELDPDIKHATNLYSRSEEMTKRQDLKHYKGSQFTNNRDITHNTETAFGSLSTTFKAMFSPVIDVLRPTRKMNVIGNARGPGNAGTSVSKGSVFNPADRTPTTIREMTEHETGHRFIGSQGLLSNRSEGGYFTNVITPTPQQRDSTQYANMGNVGNTHATSGRMLYDNAYNASLIDKSVISQGRSPTQNNVKVFTGPKSVNMQVRNDNTSFNNGHYDRPYYSQHTQSPSRDKAGIYSVKNRTYEIQPQRNNPDLLDAFRENPYTQSLCSY